MKLSELINELDKMGLTLIILALVGLFLCITIYHGIVIPSGDIDYAVKVNDLIDTIGTISAICMSIGVVLVIVRS